MQGRQLTAEELADFLGRLSETANVTLSAEMAGVSRQGLYNRRSADDAFRAAWDDAVDRGTDALEDEAIRRAAQGTEKPVFQGGREVGRVREYSDTLMIFMLKARRPERFKDRVAQELTGPGGGPIEVDSPIDRIASRLAGLAARGRPPERTE
jgi:hypothetical protein